MQGCEGNPSTNQFVTRVKKFIKIHENNENHKLFKWMYEFEDDYKGSLNAEEIPDDFSN